MTMKSSFRPAHQKSSLWLKKQKSWKNSVQWALRQVRVHCAHTVFQKILRKNNWESWNHAWKPNYSSLAWKTKKLEKQCKMSIVFISLKNKKKVGKQCAMCTALCCEHVHLAHPICQNSHLNRLLKRSLKFQKNWLKSKENVCK